MDVHTRHKFRDEWLAKALIEHAIIEESLLNEFAHRYADKAYLFDVLTHNNFLFPQDIARFIETVLQIPYVDLDTVQPGAYVIELVPESICRKYQLFPCEAKENHITIACFNPFDLNAEKEMEYLTGKYVKTFFAFKDQIQQKISEYYSPDKMLDSIMGQANTPKNVKVVGEAFSENDSSVVKLVNMMIANAVEREASDIHIEAKEKMVLGRFRIDGVLRNILEIPKAVHPSLISRIKIISGLNIAETRKPQDGKAEVIINNHPVDLRISILPTNFGEKAVIRILDKRRANVSFETLGIRGRNLKLLEKCFEFKQGMVLVTGPTGSGKTTTLYAALNRIRSSTNNILTIEDPIEYKIEGINQVQVNEKAGITFATALRSFLRQDPDVILVGEIRDPETAEIAVQAALTGHLVMSTLHTNDTFSAITRLVDMDVDVYKIVESLQAILAQRLVRRLCPECKKEKEPDKIEKKLIPFLGKLGYRQFRFFNSNGCAACGFTGYKGRIGIYEILLLDNELKAMIAKNATIYEVRKLARKKRFYNLYEDALTLIAEGIVNYQEVLRVVNPSAEDNNKIGASKSTGSASNGRIAPANDQARRTIIKSNGKKQPEHPHKILLVEDSQSLRLLTRKLIEKTTDWQYLEAENAMQAMEIIDQQQPNAIVLDVKMPGMNGFQFLRHLRNNLSTADIPVLLLTSLNSPNHEVKGLEVGADDYLVKPFNPEVLIARIKRLLVRTQYTYPEPAPLIKEDNNRISKNDFSLI